MKSLVAAPIYDVFDYSLVPPWVYYMAAIAGLCLIGLIAWWIRKRSVRPKPARSARERALDALDQVGNQIEVLTPYQFSIAVSDILRGYVMDQYQLPVTRQTSVEFLASLARHSPFSSDETFLLEDFLERCDLIKFARYDATMQDSHLLLEEATRFVKGAQLATA